jgi:hypothetical protein
MELHLRNVAPSAVVGRIAEQLTNSSYEVNIKGQLITGLMMKETLHLVSASIDVCNGYVKVMFSACVYNAMNVQISNDNDTEERHLQSLCNHFEDLNNAFRLSPEDYVYAAV